MMRPIAFVAVCSLCLATTVAESQTAVEKTVLSGVPASRTPEIEQAIESAWRSRESKGELSWTLVRTPYFASESHPTPKTIWTSYLAAYGMDIKGGLHDGQHVAAPWAHITYDNGARTFSLTLVGDRLVDSRQIQGVRPLGEAEAALLNRAPAFRDWVLAHPQWPAFNTELRELQQFYRTWLATNGVLAGLIAPRHDAFISKWVNVLVN